MRFMKKIFSLLFLIQFSFCYEPLLVVAIMVKNEEAVIQATLEPFLKADPTGQYIHYLVFDTGSTDLTIAKATELFKVYNFTHYYIFQEPFVDFSISRNRALDLVENHFSQACFVLMPDAEWYINDVKGLLDYCLKEVSNNYGPYFIRLIEAKLDFFTPRLIRQSCHSRFRGVVHEALIVYAQQLPYTRVPETIFFKYAPTRYGKEKTEQRYKRDCQLLLNQYQKDPYDTQTTFYLAQTYECLGDWENAYRYYTIRAEQKGWHEDDFLAHYRRAYCAENLFRNNKLFTWEQVHALYLQAFTFKPNRIEPLIKIAQYYLEQQNMALSFLYAKAALEIPYPAKDNSFVEKNMYDFDRYNIVGTAAWYLGYFDVGEWAVQKAIEAHPDNAALYKNLSFYLERKK